MRATLPLTFVTGNANKLKEVQQILSHHVNLQSRALDLPELQGEPEEISRQKGLLAVAEIKGPTIVEDTSLCFNALGGLPGPYIKWFLDKLGHEGLNNLLAAYEDKSAYAQCIFSFSRSEKHEPILFVGQCPGTIVPARGPNAFGWDPVFQPSAGAGNQTFAEMDKDVKNKISHRAIALEKMRLYFEQHPEALQVDDETADAASAVADSSESAAKRASP